jgi:hypothetical protein
VKKPNTNQPTAQAQHHAIQNGRTLLIPAPCPDLRFAPGFVTSRVDLDGAAERLALDRPLRNRSLARCSDSLGPSSGRSSVLSGRSCWPGVRRAPHGPSAARCILGCSVRASLGLSMTPAWPASAPTTTQKSNWTERQVPAELDDWSRGQNPTLCRMSAFTQLRELITIMQDHLTSLPPGCLQRSATREMRECAGRGDVVHAGWTQLKAVRRISVLRICSSMFGQWKRRPQGHLGPLTPG